MQHPVSWIPKNFQKLLAFGMTAGFVFPALLAPIAVYNDLLVAGLIFTGFFTRQPAISPFTQNLPQVLANIVVMKVLFPALIFLLSRPLPSDTALALVLLAALPAAGVSPSLIKLLGGNGELGLKILLCESIASCVTVPLLFSLLFAADHSVSTLALARYFAIVLMLPLLLAGVGRKLIGDIRAASFSPLGSTISVLMIVILVAAIAGKIGPSLSTNPWHSAALVALAALVVPIYALTAVFANRPKSNNDAVTYGVKNMYINIGLGLGVASTYFSADVALMLLAYVIPANLMPHIIASWSKKVVRN